MHGWRPVIAAAAAVAAAAAAALAEDKSPCWAARKSRDPN